MTKEEILDYKEHYIKTLYAKTRAEQAVDELYYNDEFPVEEVKDPHHIYRSGLGTRIIDAPAENIITRNPQAFFDVLKGSNDSRLRISEMVNQVWIDILRRQNPHVLKEFVKQQLGYGEAYFKVIHSQPWMSKKTGLPIHFIVLNSSVIYGSPEEDVNGVPERVIVFYDRQPADVIVRYPSWSNPKKRDEKSQVEWFEYWDSEQRYFEADGEPVLQGEVQQNVYGFVPFVRKYAGFGRRSPDGELSKLIVSDIRRSRDLLREECAMRSNIASVMYLFAHKPKTIISSGNIDQNQVNELSFGAYDLNVLENVPPDTKIETEDIVPSPEAFKHHADIVAELNQRHPFIMAGFPWGTSGRQQDMTQLTAMRRYDSIVENTENAFATAIEMALKICRKLNLKPDELREKDLDLKVKCQVKLKAADELEQDRRITLGDRLWAQGNGSISLQRFHTEFQGLTEDEHKKEVARMLADKVTIFNPDVATVMGMVAAQESGMERWLEMAQARRQEMEGVMKPQTPTQQKRTQGEVQTELGQEMGVEGNRGARTPPERYTRE